MAAPIRLDPVQTKARRLVTPGTIATFAFGRGAGKTFLAAALVLEWALAGAGGRQIGILYPSLKQAKQVIWPTLWPFILGPLRHEVVHKDRGQGEVTFRNGNRITTWGAENAHGIRGQRFTELVQDEADDIHPDIEHAIVRPTFSKIGTGFRWAKFGTPRRGRQGVLFRDYDRGQRGVSGYASMRVPSSESPQVVPEWLEMQRRDTPPAIFSREYECNFDSAEGLVYGDVFDAALNVRERPEGVVWSDILIGIDHGWEHPGVMLLVGVLGNGLDAVAYVLDEVYAQQRTEDWWKAKLAAWVAAYPRALVYGDPSMPGRMEAYKRDCRARVRDTDNSVEDGIGSVANMLMSRLRHDADGNEVERFARLYISPRCVNILTELGASTGADVIPTGAYRRKKDPKNPERYIDAVEKVNDDGADALRYAIFNYFGPAPGTSPHGYGHMDP